MNAARKEIFVSKEVASHGNSTKLLVCRSILPCFRADYINNFSLFHRKLYIYCPSGLLSIQSGCTHEKKYCTGT